MRTTFDHLKHYAISGSDGELGKIKDMYFDDSSWTVRYLVVDTGSWLTGRRVLLSPESITHIDHLNRIVNVGLSRDRIAEAPSVDAHVPVTRHATLAVDQFYGWHHTWITGGLIDFQVPTANYGPLVTPPEMPEEVRAAWDARRSLDPNLQSLADVHGYSVEAADDEHKLARFQDAIINEATWRIPYVVVDVGTWFTDKHAIVPVHRVRHLDANRRRTVLDMPAAVFEAAPKFDGVDTLDERQESAVIAYFAEDAARRGLGSSMRPPLARPPFIEERP
jgi:uncharacterized protein YrrD